jgi:NAD(P)-dependent dehydrogenase (short-subunit alcohol dehydrogenase family)
VSLRLRPYRLKNIRVRHLKAGQTVLVTGGARGVTAAALRELARSWSPHLVILGRTPLARDEEPEWLKGLAVEAAIRRALWQRAGEKPEPRELAGEGARIMAGREVRANLAALEKAGARVTYRSGNFEAEDELRAALGEIKRLYGPVHGFIHGAGVLADSLILDKDEADFDRVFNTKARMARLILEELEGQPLNLAVFFSSSTARFGRRGQADYAAGNEYLNKLALGLSRNRPGPKCLSVNWGPWAGGMVDESLARLFREEGVGLISLSEGARFFASLAGSSKQDPVEVVVLGRGTSLEALADGRP